MVLGENLSYASKGLKLQIEIIIEGDFLITRSYVLALEQYLQVFIV